MIVVIMRHMRFLFGCDQQRSQPDKDLTEEVGGLFPRVGVPKCFFDCAE
jgi:hypothetical protein